MKIGALRSLIYFFRRENIWLALKDLENLDYLDS